jgi:uncharacterized protein (DUF433 family)
MQLALKSDPLPLREDAEGVLRVAGTRVTLESLMELYQQGAGAEEIALSFDALDLHEVYAALGYYLAHRPVLDEYLNRQRQAAAQARQEAERRCPPAAVRARLMSRRKVTDAPAAR